jgi:apolipoprotein N-acyltransferase
MSRREPSRSHRSNGIVRETKPELLVNLTSDRWFAGSPGPALHLAMARLRAVEHRKYLLRLTTGGVSALVGPTGRTEWSLAEGRATSGAVSAHWLDLPTPYQRWRDAPWLLAVAVALLAAIVRRPNALMAPDTLGARGARIRGSRRLGS